MREMPEICANDPSTCRGLAAANEPLAICAMGVGYCWAYAEGDGQSEVLVDGNRLFHEVDRGGSPGKDNRADGGEVHLEKHPDKVWSTLRFRVGQRHAVPKEVPSLLCQMENPELLFHPCIPASEWAS